MNRRRISAFLLTATAAGTFACTSRSFVFAGIICASAAVGLSGRVRLYMAPGRRAVLIAWLALMFALVTRFVPFDDYHVPGFLFYPVAHAWAQYFLTVMVLVFFIRPEPPAWLPLCGVVVMICAGDVLADFKQDIAYQLLSLLFVGFAVSYFAACRPYVPRDPRARRAGLDRTLLGAGIVAVTLLLGWVAADLLKKYERSIERLMPRGRGAVRLPGGVGFSKAGRLESISGIKTSSQDAPALRVFGERAPGYLRGAAFTRFEDSQWRPPGAARRIRPSPPNTAAAPSPRGHGRVFVVHEVQARRWRELDIWPVPGAAHAMFAPLVAAAVAAPVDELTVSECDVIGSRRLGEGVNYSVLVPDRRPAPPLSARLRANCLAVPEALDPRIKTLAQRIFAGREDTHARISAVVKHFRTNYKYRIGLTVPAGQDPLTWFLTEKPAAHCEYFATGAAVLLRLAGVPTRYVAGFVVAERNSQGGYWVARNRDAHAWVEAWDDCVGRWVTVEATPPAGLPSRRSASALAGMWDLLKFRMQELRVAIHLHGLKGLAVWCLRRLADLPALMLTTIPGLAVTTLLVLYTIVRLRRRQRPRAKRAAEKPDPGVAAIRRLLARTDVRLRKRGLVRQPTETLHQFSRRIHAEGPPDAPLAQFSSWYLRYARLRYLGRTGPDELAELARTIPTRK